MSNTMEYKGYLGSVEFSEADALLFGKVMGIRALISYEGESAFTLLWMNIWSCVPWKALNRNGHTRAASMSASPRSSTSKRRSQPWPSRCP